MTIAAIHQVFLGGLIATSAMAMLFFMRFYVLSGDRFFIFFAGAFGLFALNSLFLVVVPPNAESQHHILLLRLFGFLLIIAGVIDKNRRAARATIERKTESRD